MNPQSLIYNPRIYTLSSLIIGYLLIDDLTANEQNALGNWLMTIGQILEANAAVQQVIEERFKGNTYNINSEQFKNGGSPFMNNDPLFNFASINEETINEIKKTLRELIEKINNLDQK